jgi:hypothetical protein
VYHWTQKTPSFYGSSCSPLLLCKCTIICAKWILYKCMIILVKSCNFSGALESILRVLVVFVFLNRVVFCEPLILSFFCWSWYRLSFFDLRILFPSLVSSNFHISERLSKDCQVDNMGTEWPVSYGKNYHLGIFKIF